MTNDHIDYELQVQHALRYVMRDVLARVAEEGLPGEHHFYITFQTTYHGVVMPEYLREKYPDEMTIVLQEQYWDLIVTEEGFSVDLKFSGHQTTLCIPFDAVSSFVDPSVQFALQFTDIEDEGITTHPEFLRHQELPEPAIEEDLSAPIDSGDSGDNVVTLDAFRKK